MDGQTHSVASLERRLVELQRNTDVPSTPLSTAEIEQRIQALQDSLEADQDASLSEQLVTSEVQNLEFELALFEATQLRNQVYASHVPNRAQRSRAYTQNTYHTHRRA
jgi:hypothetical protein